MTLSSGMFNEEIYYKFSGHRSGKSPLILLMGYSGTIDSWTRSFLDRLSEKWPILAIDLVGTGRSAKNITADRLAYEAIAGDVCKLMQSLGIERAHILGYSYGGTVAMSFSQYYPQLCQSLILVATTLGGAEYVSPSRDILERLNNPPGDSVYEKTKEIWTLCLGQDKIENFVKVMDEILDCQKDGLTPGWVLRKQLAHYLAFSFSQQAALADIPVTIITGDEDPLTPAANSLNLHKAFARSQLEMIKSCRHMPHLEYPETYINLICQHLGSIDGNLD